LRRGRFKVARGITIQGVWSGRSQKYGFDENLYLDDIDEMNMEQRAKEFRKQ